MLTFPCCKHGNRIETMKKLTAIFLISAALALQTGCVKDMGASHPKDTPNEYNEFDFETRTPTALRVDYGDMGGIPASVYFEVYDTCPVAANASGTGYEKITAEAPLFAGYTDERGCFAGTVELPAYVQKAYVYTPVFYAQTLLEATRIDGTLTAAAEKVAVSAAPATRAGGYRSRAVEKDGWKTWLGSYDDTFGRIDYAYNGDLRVKNYKALYKAHASVFDTSKKCPQEYRSSKDLYLEKSAEVVITMLGSNTCWNCSMGYYYYKTGEKPRSLKETDVIMIFPNTQDGQWSVNRKEASKYAGVKRGTAVQLMYYPHLAENSTEGATTVFPEGYRIGFVLATNAWTNRLSGFRVDKNYRAATSDGLSVDNKGVAYNEPRTAVFRYTDKKEDINSVLFSFEDYVDDQNFSDVVFTMTSNPVDAVVDIPSVDVEDTKKVARMLRGVYAFEDLWPSRGDYDMNDVMLRSNYEKTFDEKGIYEESFLLTTFANYAGNDNGIAVTLGGAAASAELEMNVLVKGETEYRKAEFTRDADVLLLSDNVKTQLGATYKITAKYSSPVDESQAGSVKPFIYRTNRSGVSEGNRWEVHLPYEAPTSKIEASFFGQGDDRSIPRKGIYYVRADSYPFAFFLAGANESDIAPLLDLKNEKTPIDQLYPGYIGWVTSNGKENTDWYKR